MTDGSARGLPSPEFDKGALERALGALRNGVARLILPIAARPGSLRFWRFEGEEAIGSLFEWRIEALSAEASLDFEAWLGQPMALALERPGIAIGNAAGAASDRFFHGHLAAVRQAGSVGRYYRYTLTLRPWLWLLSRNADCRIFQELSTPEIARALFGEHAGVARVQSRLGERYAKRRYCVQYRESDFAFVTRLFEEDGIGYHFRHEEAGHTLVLTDALSTREPTPGYARIPYSAGSAIEQGVHEAITLWHHEREIRPGRVLLADYDFKKPAATLQAGRSDPRAHAHADAAQFDYPGAYYNDPHAEGEAGVGEPLGTARAQIALERFEAAHHRLGGSTNARGITSGAVFTLTDSPRNDQNGEHLIIAATHALQMTGLEARPGTADPPSYRCELTVLPVATTYRPPLRTARAIVSGPQTATVVGPAGEEIHTDRFGRVKLRFHWDRNPGTEAAPLPNERLTCWVRISQPWAGQQWGGNFLPRVGQEVLVDFLEGNPDRPIVTGRLYNASQMPAAFSQAGALPRNKALAGLRSKEYQGTGYNELLFDDTNGELRTKLSSEAGKSQLNLGHLVHPRAEESSAPRGEGFELRTDQWGAVRAAKGLFLSADGRHQALGGQLSREELVRCLEEALKLARSLTDQAGAHQADSADSSAREAIGAAAKQWGNGSNAEASDSGSGAGGEPLIALSAPAGIALATPKGITATSGENTDLIAQKNQQLTSGQQTHLHAGTGVRVFAHSGGIKSIAHQGQHLVQAQHDDVVVNAGQSVHLTASQAHVLIEATSHITLVEAGGAYLKLQGGAIELGCPGAFTVKAASYNLVGPASAQVELPKFATGDVGRALRLLDPASGTALQNAKFSLSKTSGALDGSTDGSGRTPLDESPHYEFGRFEFKKDLG